VGSPAPAVGAAHQMLPIGKMLPIGQMLLIGKMLPIGRMLLILPASTVGSVFKASSRRGDKASRKLRRLGRLIFSVLLFFPFLFPISLLFQTFF
jgi:hypothetical protein